MRTTLIFYRGLIPPILEPSRAKQEDNPNIKLNPLLLMCLCVHLHLTQGLIADQIALIQAKSIWTRDCGPALNPALFLTIFGLSP